MIARPRVKHARSRQGMSLIELLFAATIIGVAAAGISGLVLLNNMTSTRLFNKVDGLNAARTVIERIGADIREGQMIGGQFGLMGPNPQPPPNEIIYPADYFPTPLNPLYGSGQSPPGGCPATPWPGKPYTLSNTCLIVQLPVFYLNPLNDPHDPLYNASAAQDPLNGFPTRIEIGTGNPPTTTLCPNTDTFVYQVLPDPDKPGEYMLQLAVFPGLPPPAPARQRPVINPPQTLLKGITGPINPATGSPQVFQFLDKTDPIGMPKDTVGTSAANITGVLINLEIKRTGAGETGASNIGLRSAFYMRNNSVATP